MDYIDLESRSKGKVHHFFQDLILKSREDLGMASVTGLDNCVNTYLSGVLTHYVRRNFTSPWFSDIVKTIESRRMGMHEKTLRLRRMADSGLIFYGLFHNGIKEDYFEVSSAYHNAANIGRLTPMNETDWRIFYDLGARTNRYIGLLSHMKKFYFSDTLTEAEMNMLGLPKNEQEALDSYLDYKLMYERESDDRKKEDVIKPRLIEAAKLLRSYNPKFILPELGSENHNSF